MTDEPRPPDPSLPAPAVAAPVQVADDASGADRQRADYVRGLIASRCPEIGPADLELLAARPDPDRLPAAIGERILEVVERFADRLDEFEERLAGRPGA